MNINKLTKPQLVERLVAQSAELAALRTQLSEARATLDILRTSKPAPQASRYPLVDGRGRHYRMEGRVKCYQPS